MAALAQPFDRDLLGAYPALVLVVLVLAALGVVADVAFA